MVDTFSGQPMDEVLASIRKIIAEDRPAAVATAPTASPSEDDEEVLELGDPPPVPAGPLLSDISAVASRQAFAALSGLTIDPSAPVNSLDGMVREMLRPMVKAWLDANLPELVERMVAREIARVGGH